MLAMWQIERKPCNKCTDLNTKRHFTVWYVELTGFDTGETVLKIIYCYGCFLFVFLHRLYISKVVINMFFHIPVC